jgi:hypothetical protein
MDMYFFDLGLLIDERRVHIESGSGSIYFRGGGGGHIIEMEKKHGRTFGEAMQDEIATILDFAKGLEHQMQFRDQWMLMLLQREGAGSLRLARTCLHKNRKFRRRHH